MTARSRRCASRIFLASALLAVLSHRRRDLPRQVARDQRSRARRCSARSSRPARRWISCAPSAPRRSRMMARLIADLPKLKAAVDTNDPPTVQDIAGGYQRAAAMPNLLLVTNKPDRCWRRRRRRRAPRAIAPNQPAVRDALAGRDSLSLLPQPNGILQVVTVPITIGRAQPEILGTLSAGFLLDDALAAQLKKITGSDVAFGMDGQILASTLPRTTTRCSPRVCDAGMSRRQLGRRGVRGAAAAARRRRRRRAGRRPVALMLRSRTEQLQFLQRDSHRARGDRGRRRALATLLSFAVARTITRPLAAITDVMREVAATGDLTRKIALRARRRLGRRGRAAAGDDLQHADRFGRALPARDVAEGAAVVARPPVDGHRARSAQSADDHQGARCTRCGSSDADAAARARGGRGHRRRSRAAEPHRQRGARLRAADPLRARRRPTSTRSAASRRPRAQAAGRGAAVRSSSIRRCRRSTTDAERLRIALVNMLVNARHAVNGTPDGAVVACATQPPGSARAA